MRKSIVIFVLIICLLPLGCSPGVEGNREEEIKKLDIRIAELEKENLDLKAEIVSFESAQAEEIKAHEGPSDESSFLKREANAKDDIEKINIGDTIASDRVEITIRTIELSYEVYPRDTSGRYRYYPAESGKVYIHIDTDVKNIQKQNIVCDEIMNVTADYDDGYTYDSFAAPNDGDRGFTYGNITSITPLETLGVSFLIECPQEVEEMDHPLFLIFEVDGLKFRHSIR